MDNSLEVLHEQCIERRNNITDALSGGVAKDYAEYRAMCGEIRGLSLAEGYILDLADQMERNNDD